MTAHIATPFRTGGTCRKLIDAGDDIIAEVQPRRTG